MGASRQLDHFEIDRLSRICKAEEAALIPVLQFVGERT
jgi:hypothetical protein